MFWVLGVGVMLRKRRPSRWEMRELGGHMGGAMFWVLVFETMLRKSRPPRWEMQELWEHIWEEKFWVLGVGTVLKETPKMGDAGAGEDAWVGAMLEETPKMEDVGVGGDAQDWGDGWDKGLLNLGGAGGAGMPWQVMLGVGVTLGTRGWSRWELQGLVRCLGG